MEPRGGSTAHTRDEADSTMEPPERHAGSARASVDSSKPILAQVGYLGRDYSRWLQSPETCQPRFFASPVLEAVTSTQWWVVPLVWAPVVAWGLCSAVGSRAASGASAGALAGALLWGFLIWQALEYSIHRFVFHQKPSSYWGVTVHFTLHGCHHKFPMDKGRLVFPPLPAAVLAAGLLAAIRVFMPKALAFPTFIGLLAGYLTYDCLHYAIHHSSYRSSPALTRVRAAHMDHHYRHTDAGFGISSPLFDILLGTLPPRK